LCGRIFFAHHVYKHEIKLLSLQNLLKFTLFLWLPIILVERKEFC
jgi:hypothetical protein